MKVAFHFGVAFGVIAAIASAAAAQSPATRPARVPPPTRDPHTPGCVIAQELPDGTIPPADADGNFIIVRRTPAHRRWSSRQASHMARSTTWS